MIFVLITFFKSIFWLTTKRLSRGGGVIRVSNISIGEMKKRKKKIPQNLH